MDIEEFVKDVLGQVTRAVNDNATGGKTKYSVDYNDGISFDLAVVTSSMNTQSKGISGGMKVKVLGAEASKQQDTQDRYEQSSRVKFKVDMYTQSDDSGVDSY